MSTESRLNPEKALVAKYWTAAVLTEFGFKIKLSPNKAKITAIKNKCVLRMRTKACYSEQGVPFNGFKLADSDFVILVDLRQTTLKAQVWIVPTQILYTELEQAYEAMGRAHLSNRTFYWKNGHKPHYGYERKLEPYRNAWHLLRQGNATKLAD